MCLVCMCKSVTASEDAYSYLSERMNYSTMDPIENTQIGRCEERTGLGRDHHHLWDCQEHNN